MISFVMVASALAAVNGTTVAISFDGYYAFSSTNITIDQHDPMCDQVRPPNAAIMAVCDAMACPRFNLPDGCIKQWVSSSVVDSYISFKTCGQGVAPDIVNGSCLSPARKYLVCSTGGAEFHPLNFFKLPPSLIKSSCDQDARCSGFMVYKDQSGGYTLSYATSDVNTGYISVPSS